MDTDDRIAIEKIPLGTVSIHFQSGVANSPDLEKNTGDILKSILRELAHRGFGKCYLLRAVIFATDFGKEVIHWQKLLGHEVGYTRESYGEAVGKSFTWGDGKIERTYGLIVAAAAVGAALLKANPLARGLVAHELGHISDSFYLIGSSVDFPEPKNQDLPGVLRCLASGIRSEAYAEYVACPYWPETHVKDSIELTLNHFRNLVAESEAALLGWTRDRNFFDLWIKILRHTSSTCSQFGRLMGTLGYHGNLVASEEREFFHSLYEIDPFLARLFEKIRTETFALLAANPLTIQSFAGMESFVLDLFTLLGISPSMGEKGLWIQVL